MQPTPPDPRPEDAGDEEEEGVPTSATWARQVFRSLMSEAELAGYLAAIEAECPPDAETFGGIGAYAEEDYRKYIPRLFPGHPAIFAALFNTLYFLIAPIGRLLERRRTRLPEGRPLRVLRLVSVITQGGVAKVCLQSMLPADPAQVEYTLFPFGEKRATRPELRNRPAIRLFNRKMVLWPSSYRFKLFANIFKLGRIIARNRPDLIHLHEPQFAPVVRMAAALAGGVPVCVHLHNDYNERNNSIHEPFTGVTRHALRRSHLLACSQTILEAGKAWLGPTRTPIHLIEDGADDIIEDLPEDDLPQRLVRAAGGRPIVAMMTHIVLHKRIDDFLNGCRILLDGGMPIYVLLMAYGKKRKGRQMRRRFNQYISPHEGEYLYRVHQPTRMLPHVQVGVSTSVLEGLGLNILEFQMHGVPVICTDLRPHREMVTDGESGLLFEGLNVAQFVATLRKVLTDPALRERLAAGGHAAARRRRWAETAAATAAWYRAVLSTPR